MTNPEGLRREWDYDVLIAGGSLAGLTLAAWLGHSGLRVVVVEAQEGMAGTPTRVYALMPLTQRIWERVGLWAQLEPLVQPYRQIDLSDLGCHAVVFTPADLGGKQVLGYVGEHGKMWPVCREWVTRIPTVDYWSGTRLVALRVTAEAAWVQLQRQGETQTLAVGLVVGADGVDSQVRRLAGIGTWGWQYWQSCLTTVLQADQEPIAYERFWPAGPLALLPLPGQRWGIVWTLPHEQAAALVSVPEGEFLAQLAPFMPFTGGRLVGERQCFRVGWRQARRYVRPRVALVGDAAHRCHPVGGQGLNLGLRDVATLGEVVVTAHERGEDIGSLQVLQRYERWRWPQVWISLWFIDSLNRLFSQGGWLVVRLRAWLLQTMQRVGLLRRVSLGFMAGLWGKLPAHL